MTDGAMTGGSIGVWAIAIIILFAMFNNNGLFGANNVANGYGNDCVTNRNLLEFGFYNMNNTNSKIEALGNQSAQQFFNLRETIDQNELNRVRDELSETRTKLAMCEQGRYMDAQFSIINSELASIRCNMPKRPPFYSCGVIPNGCNYPCGNTSEA